MYVHGIYVCAYTHRHVCTVEFSLFIAVIFYKVIANTELLANTESLFLKEI